MNSLTNAATITIVRTGESYHTLRDWGLAISNNNYIGEPVQETKYVDVPGRNGPIDMSEVVAGRPVYKYRPINISVGAMNPRTEWDSIISELRNILEGEQVKIIFDNDPEYYWFGRAYIKEFDRVRELGTFSISIPQADPYKYDITSSVEDWLWDPFNFDTGVIRFIGNIDVNDSAIDIPKGNMPVTPVVIVNSISSERLSMAVGEKNYTLTVGRNRFPQILVDGKTDETLQFTGQANLSIEYRGGSL